MKLRIKGHLFHCGRCGKRYSSPLGHVCITRLDRKARTGKTTLAPKVTATCTRCRKPLGNPLTHTCTTRTDFKARRKAAAKAAPQGSKPARPAHRYEACQDEGCPRIPCTAHREGYDSGYRDGYAAGRAAAES